MSYLRSLPDKNLYHHWGFEGFILGTLAGAGIRVPPLLALGENETRAFVTGELDRDRLEKDRERLFQKLGFNDPEWPVQLKLSWALPHAELLALSPEKRNWKRWIPVDTASSFERELKRIAGDLGPLFDPSLRILLRSGVVTVAEGRFSIPPDPLLGPVPESLQGTVKKIDGLAKKRWPEFGPIELRYVSDGEEVWITDADVKA